MAETTSKKQSLGVCELCGSVLPKSRMTAHLGKCIEEHEAQAKAPKSPAREVTFFHILVEGRYVPGYWLHLDMPTTARLRKLDEFLRDIWLECCGHLSQFTIAGADYLSSPDPDGYDLDTRSMNVRVADELAPGTRFRHEYDFGTTTELNVRVLAQRVGPNRREAVRLLARNNPPDRPCAVCGKPATTVCSLCIYTDQPAWYCEECHTKHKCSEGDGEDYFLPVVNSPRVGMCAYTG